MIIDRAGQSPGDNLDYQNNHSPWLASGETIVDSSWTVETGLVKTNEATGDSNTTVWLSGGSDGNDYDVLNRVVTSGGRIRERTFVLVVRQQ